MTDRDRLFLANLCTELNRRFPGVSAGFEGFVSPYLGGDCDGFLLVEIFNVPENQMESVLKFGESLTRAHLMAGGAFVTLNLWTPEDTQASFQDDLLALEQRPSVVFGAITAESIVGSSIIMSFPGGLSWEPGTTSLHTVYSETVLVLQPPACEVVIPHTDQRELAAKAA